MGNTISKTTGHITIQVYDRNVHYFSYPLPCTSTVNYCWWYWVVSKHICYKQKCKAVDKNNNAYRNYKVCME